MSPTSAAGPEVFVARQPILDRDEAITAYELLFRASADATTAGPLPDPTQTSFRTMLDAFMRIGAERLLGRHLGFVNVPPDLLMSELVEALPHERVVLEVLETTRPDEAVVARCQQLVARGYTLALDDWVPGDPRGPLLPLATYVKVDLAGTPPDALAEVARALRAHASVQLVAEKVETQEDVACCRRAGFELFQGYFFARPQTLSARAPDPRQAVLFAIFRDLAADADTEVLGDHFKRNVELGFGLLRLVNSVALTRGQGIATVEHALTMLGRQQLRRWLLVMLFAGPRGDALANPLLHASAARGRLMELVARGDHADGPARDRGERAFLTGMVSLLDVAVGLPPAQLVRELSLEAEVADAILAGRGELGTLLALATSLERSEVDRSGAIVREMGLDADRLLRAEAEAWAWTDELTAGAEAGAGTPSEATPAIPSGARTA